MTKREELANPNSCINKCSDDETIFSLLSRDEAAPHAVRAWMAKRIEIGKKIPGDDVMEDAERVAKQMELERSSNEDKSRNESADPPWKDRLVFDFDVSEISPVVKGTWVTVTAIVSEVVDGFTWNDILRRHPEITEDDIRMCLSFALEEQKEGQPR